MKKANGSVWIGMNPPPGPSKDIRLGPCEAKATRPMPQNCDRCGRPGTPENPLKTAEFSGRLRHSKGCSGVQGPKVGRG